MTNQNQKNYSNLIIQRKPWEPEQIETKLASAQLMTKLQQIQRKTFVACAACRSDRIVWLD
jgi:hypothetical protein